MKAEEHAGLAVVGRRRLVGGGGWAGEVRGTWTHPKVASARPEPARGLLATRTGGVGGLTDGLKPTEVVRRASTMRAAPCQLGSDRPHPFQALARLVATHGGLAVATASADRLAWRQPGGEEQRRRAKVEDEDARGQWSRKRLRWRRMGAA